MFEVFFFLLNFLQVILSIFLLQKLFNNALEELQTIIFLFFQCCDLHHMSQYEREVHH